MKKKMFTAILVFCSLYFAKADILSFLPDTSEFNGLTILKSPVIYNGNDLYTLIDGGADLYMEYGFIKAVDAAYLLNGTSRIDIQIYEMTDAGAAYGIYTNSRSESDTLTLNNPLAFIKSQYAMFCKDRYFGVISLTDNSDEWSTSFLTDLVEKIASKIENNKPFPELVGKLLKAGFSYNQLKYIRGKLALSSSYFFSNNDIFNISEAVSVNTETSQIIVFSYANKDTSSNRFESIKKEFSTSTRITGFSSTESQFRFIDRKNRNVLIAKEDKYIMAVISPDDPVKELQSFLEVF